MIHAAVLDACDALDGVQGRRASTIRGAADSIRPVSCARRRRPELPHRAAARGGERHLRGTEEPAHRRADLPGLEPGSETNWVPVAALPGPLGVYDSHFKYLVFANPQWSYLALNFDGDIALADQMDRNTINATDPDLTKFSPEVESCSCTTAGATC